jgi:hypothetical protein
LVSGDHSFTSFTSTSIAFRHPKRYPQDSSFARPNLLANHQSNLYSIVPLQGRTPSATHQNDHLSTCDDPSHRELVENTSIANLRTSNTSPFEPSNLRTSYKTTSTAPRPRTWKPSIPLAHHYYSSGSTTLRNTYVRRTLLEHLNSDFEPPETSIFPTIFLRFLHRITSISYIHTSLSQTCIYYERDTFITFAPSGKPPLLQRTTFFIAPSLRYHLYGTFLIALPSLRHHLLYGTTFFTAPPSLRHHLLYGTTFFIVPSLRYYLYGTTFFIEPASLYTTLRNTYALQSFRTPPELALEPL